jgi:Flp pilus assembly protein TadD
VDPCQQGSWSLQLAELRRLVELRRAYTSTDEGDDAAAHGDFDAALAHYRRSMDLSPDNPEMAFWFGVSLAAGGKVDEARRVLALAFAVHDGWAELLRRLPAAGLFPDDPALLAELLA